MLTAFAIADSLSGISHKPSDDIIQNKTKMVSLMLNYFIQK